MMLIAQFVTISISYNPVNHSYGDNKSLICNNCDLSQSIYH